MLMPFALNTHIRPVIYEILQGGTLLVENDAAVREVFVRRAEERIAEEREALVEQAKEAGLQARNLGFGLMAQTGSMLPQPPRYLAPIRFGWRLARSLGAVAMLDQTTRDPERPARDTERLGQVVGWFSNAAGAPTGIAKAMLNMSQVPRPPRRWEVFLPLADAHLMTTELALQLAAAVELRWSLLTGGRLIEPARGARWGGTRGRDHRSGAADAERQRTEIRAQPPADRGPQPDLPRGGGGGGHAGCPPTTGDPRRRPGVRPERLHHRHPRSGRRLGRDRLAGGSDHQDGAGLTSIRHLASLDALIAAFNEGGGTVRVLALLSPT